MECKQRSGMVRPVRAMPRPGDTVGDIFFVSPGRCFRMVQSPQLQTTHCAEPAVWRGRWTDVNGRVHRVDACDVHGAVLKGLRRV